MTSPVTDDELNEYLDGGLSEKRRAEVEAWLLENPERTAEFERLKELNEALRRLGAEILDEPVPEKLRNIVRKGTSSEPGQSGGTGSKKGQALGVATMLLIGLTFGQDVTGRLEDATPTRAVVTDDQGSGSGPRSRAIRSPVAASF